MIKCPLPYMHTTVHTQGYVTPCCNASPSDDEFWYSTDIKDGLDAEYYNNIRDQLENNIWPDICTVCKYKESNGFPSPRIAALKDFDYNPTEIKLKYLDVKFSNKCNLMCRMCFPSSSSLIEEYYKVNELPDFLKNEPFKDLNNSDKIDAVKDAIKNGLEILKVTGGEPFASREFIEIVKWSIANNYASNLRLFITTNGTKFSKTLLDKLVNFKEVKFTISVEGTEDVYTYIRHRSSWKQLNQNIQNLTNYKSKFNNISIRVSCVLTAYNLFDIKNLAFWCNVNELNLHVDFNLKPYDSELSVRHLPSKLIAEAVFEIKPFNFSGVDALISFLSDHCSYNEERCKTLLATTQLFDKQRNESYTVLDNRLVDFLNNV